MFKDKSQDNCATKASQVKRSYTGRWRRGYEGLILFSYTGQPNVYLHQITRKNIHTWRKTLPTSLSTDSLLEKLQKVLKGKICSCPKNQDYMYMYCLQKLEQWTALALPSKATSSFSPEPGQCYTSLHMWPDVFGTDGNLYFLLYS